MLQLCVYRVIQLSYTLICVFTLSPCNTNTACLFGSLVQCFGCVVIDASCCCFVYNSSVTLFSCLLGNFMWITLHICDLKDSITFCCSYSTFSEFICFKQIAAYLETAGLLSQLCDKKFFRIYNTLNLCIIVYYINIYAIFATSYRQGRKRMNQYLDYNSVCRAAPGFARVS